MHKNGSKESGLGTIRAFSPMVADCLILPMVFIHFRLQIVSCDCNITTSVKK